MSECRPKMINCRDCGKFVSLKRYKWGRSREMPEILCYDCWDDYDHGIYCSHCHGYGGNTEDCYSLDQGFLPILNHF